MSPKREWRRLIVTRRQAREMADAIWRLQQRAEQLAEIAGVQNRPTQGERVALHELRVRLYAAADDERSVPQRSRMEGMTDRHRPPSGSRAGSAWGRFHQLHL